MSHHWENLGSVGAEYVGFLYEVTGPDGRKYIGKKFFYYQRSKKKAGRKNRVRYQAPSGWEYYTGSSKELNADIAKLGKENFTFTVIKKFKTRSALRYAEIERIVKSDALKKIREDGQYAYYNHAIDAIRGRPKDE